MIADVYQDLSEMMDALRDQFEGNTVAVMYSNQKKNMYDPENFFMLQYTDSVSQVKFTFSLCRPSDYRNPKQIIDSKLRKEIEQMPEIPGLKPEMKK